MRANRKGSLPPPELEFNDSRLIRFYRGLEKDPAGRMIEDIWQMTTPELERNHDYIQWLFPLPQRSNYSPGAPVLTQQDIDSFIRDENLRERVLISYGLMLRFYGLEQRQLHGQPVLVPAADFAQRAAEWLQPGNHNYLRISRILNFLMLVQMKAEARILFSALEELNLLHHKKVGSAFSYWRAAVT
ncbi:MAG: hypothetical protein JO301_13640 [Chitinophagaceae bacterium]|nr:hypothetical protein [Chitinophagaceae bacterium]